eukprot:Amastigsp_a678938_12.p2 type:complete len:237 gc:universal Amastigsp_a678938_12:1124-414(-)
MVPPRPDRRRVRASACLVARLLAGRGWSADARDCSGAGGHLVSAAGRHPPSPVAGRQALAPRHRVHIPEAHLHGLPARNVPHNGGRGARGGSRARPSHRAPAAGLRLPRKRLQLCNRQPARSLCADSRRVSRLGARDPAADRRDSGRARGPVHVRLAAARADDRGACAHVRSRARRRRRRERALGGDACAPGATLRGTHECSRRGLRRPSGCCAQRKQLALLPRVPCRGAQFRGRV